MVQNEAILNTGDPINPTAGIDTMYIESDGDNLVCAQEMFFDISTRMCTRFPYKDDFSIAYLVTNNV